MIGFVQGELVERQPMRAVILCGGVGYDIAIPLSTFDRLPEPGSACRLLTRLVVREDAHLLFGFASAEERSIFDLLLGVSRIGPKLALAVLSGMTVAEVHRAIVREDFDRLARIPGLGRRTAERIVVELKDKLGRDTLELPPQGAGGDGVGVAEAVAALVVLGYTRSEAQQAVTKAAKAMSGKPSTTDLIRHVLSARSE